MQKLGPRLGWHRRITTGIAMCGGTLVLANQRNGGEAQAHQKCMRGVSDMVERALIVDEWGSE
ncbi:hypothetical protein HOP61_11750 [Halomonas daqingensis]|uniref:Uncharacterized protein n=1 Tax=Billgrantia desiderata TaxID=52021 RepID=A0AAW4YVC5_9GAMM|nr:hypothetical protein [Halomonas desiderata]MCE8051971.1 hypothetical protein [Halomonas desiderata]